MSIWTIAFAIYQNYMKLRDPKMPNPDQPFDQKAAVAALLFRKSAAYTSYYPSILDPRRVISSSIGKLNEEQAKLEAGLFVDECKKQGLDLGLAIAGAYQESRWYPGTYNKNLAKHKGVESFGGTDWGMCQNSGFQLPTLPGMAGLTNDQMSAKAMDPNWAIPQFVATMKHLVVWAENLLTAPVTGIALVKTIKTLPDWCIQSDMLSGQTSEGLREAACWMATAAYNAGQTGLLAIINNGGSKGSSRAPHILPQDQFIHGYDVIQWYREFSPLVTPPVAQLPI